MADGQLPNDLPPEKWFFLRYGFEADGAYENGEEEKAPRRLSRSLGRLMR